MILRPNERSGVDGGTARLWRAERPRPAAPHHERWALPVS